MYLTTTYYNLSQLSICQVVLKMNLINKQLFSFDVFFHDGKNMVCKVNVDPVIRDHRTGEWSVYTSLSTYEHVYLDPTTKLRDKIRRCAEQSVKHLVDMFFGEE